jgi:hypothetical protein
MLTITVILILFSRFYWVWWSDSLSRKAEESRLIDFVGLASPVENDSIDLCV